VPSWNIMVVALGARFVEVLVKRLVLALLLVTLLLTACGGLIRAGQTPIPGPTGSPSPTGTGTDVPGPLPGAGGEEGSDGAPGGGQAGVGDEGQAEEPVTEGPTLTG
jgi:hypothetical protein